MKYLTHVSKAFLYTADWYDYTTNGPDRTYLSTPSGFITFNGGEGAGGNLKIYTDRTFRDFVRLDNLKDATGELIYPDYESNGEKGARFEVRNAQPLLNIWGVSEGYRMMLVRI